MNMKSVILNRTCTRIVLVLYPQQLQTNAQNYSHFNIMGMLQFVLDSPGYKLLELFHSLVSCYVYLGYLLKQSRKLTFVEFTSHISALFASFLFILSMCFIIGAYHITTWFEPSFILSLSVFPSILKGQISHYSKFSVFGFILGSFAFPLDWPVTWKNPPISNIFLMTIFGFIGLIFDSTLFNF